MRGEQLELMKVIQFPKNKETEFKIIKSKVNTAIKMIDYITDFKKDFNIVLDRSAAEEIFDMREFIENKNVVITSNFEKAKKIFDIDKFYFYILQGNEF